MFVLRYLAEEPGESSSYEYTNVYIDSNNETVTEYYEPGYYKRQQDYSRDDDYESDIQTGSYSDIEI